EPYPTAAKALIRQFIEENFLFQKPIISYKQFTHLYTIRPHRITLVYGTKNGHPLKEFQQYVH
ncbi:9049_t:CDS:1, partial [Gigaspora rosea]